MAARIWTGEQRKQQSLKIRQWQPWQQITEAKTVEGKARASRNAFKGGFNNQIKALRKILHEQKKSLDKFI